MYPYTAGTYGSIPGSTQTPGICTDNSSLIKYDDLPGVVNQTNLTRYDNITNADI